MDNAKLFLMYIFLFVVCLVLLWKFFKFVIRWLWSGYKAAITKKLNVVKDFLVTFTVIRFYRDQFLLFRNCPKGLGIFLGLVFIIDVLCILVIYGILFFGFGISLKFFSLEFRFLYFLVNVTVVTLFMFSFYIKENYIVWAVQDYDRYMEETFEPAIASCMPNNKWYPMLQDPFLKR